MQELAERVAERANEVDAVEKREKAKKAQAPPADLRPFLRPVGVMETRYIRMLSNLSALTYTMHKITVDGIYRRHRLNLVTTSRACGSGAGPGQVSPLQAMEDGDAMAADVGSVAAFQEALSSAGAMAAEGSQATQALAARPAAAAAAASPTDAVASSLSAAAAAAASAASAASAAAFAAASAAAGSVYSAAAPSAGNIIAFTASVTSSTPVQSVASQLQSAASAGHSTALATVAAVSAALEATWSRERGGRAAAAARESSSPTEWFVADDADAGVRYFVVQGSDTLDHWRVNLTFDPVMFEDPSLGVKVHRGVYETAQILYDRFLPLVREHLAAAPAGRVAFTGHSLGGSLGTLLMLMYVYRGVLRPDRLAPVYTFGAPAIFCEGGAFGCSGACFLEDAAAEAAGASAAPGGILRRLGLPQGSVRNVLMHLDIVPRAFACDYSSVADLLKRVGGSFREHKCLAGERQVLFNFVGKMMVLQPGNDATFVRGQGLHPLLPPRAGLYALRRLGALDAAAAQVRRDAQAVGDAVRSVAERAVSNLSTATAADVGGARPDPPPPPGATAAPTAALAAPRRVPESMTEAVWELMNTPHPLETLGDPASYGERGTISRFHNPDNYTRALGGVLGARGSAWRRLVANARDAGVRCYLPALSPSPLPQGAPRAEPATRVAGGKARAPPAHPLAPRHVY